MPEIRLPKLPDRTPVKLTITITPDLSQALADYAKLYHQTYGQAEQVSELIPYMLRSFLDADRTFIRVRSAGGSK